MKDLSQRRANTTRHTGVNMQRSVGLRHSMCAHAGRPCTWLMPSVFIKNQVSVRWTDRKQSRRLTDVHTVRTLLVWGGVGAGGEWSSVTLWRLPSGRLRLSEEERLLQQTARVDPPQQRETGPQAERRQLVPRQRAQEPRVTIPADAWLTHHGWC